VPFGWRRAGKGHPIQADPVAARELRMAAQQIAAGGSLAQIAADWNPGVRTVTGRPHGARLRSAEFARRRADANIQVPVIELGINPCRRHSHVVAIRTGPHRGPVP